ncbi:hypothetical protein EZH22_19990 [Xanthobacter dioxanivorans]|uniref:Cupin domain-containing protein n=1 Tax=Xanthobacter dioxanivorans TaxID=2528964 RepID=A0A974PKN8_9HYPH|nr:hypothetical protein [Xanthobacter dioxanivorans]QRG05352.1 hypothetical protein EZH22_19990 [Xanthobacter dioxanivorans]
MGKHIITNWPAAPAAWPAALQAELVARSGDGRVGSRLVSQTDRVRVWMITLAPGERIAFHTHVLDYFWTCTTGGAARSHYSDGRTVDVTYTPGETRHMTFDAGAFMIHDLENTGPETIVFTTVEFLDSANAPLPLPADVLEATSAAA